MIGQGIQEKTGTPARCAHRRGKTQAVTAKCSRTPAHFTTKKGGIFPFRREFFTFSTGFSTWKSGFAYTSRNAARRSMPVSGKKSGHFAFYIKESRRIFFSFYSSFRLTIRSLSRLEKRSPEFSTERKRRFFVWKKRENCSFPPSAAVLRQRVLHMPFLLRNASGIARLLVFRPALCPVKKLPPSRFTPELHPIC